MMSLLPYAFFLACLFSIYLYMRYTRMAAQYENQLHFERLTSSKEIHFLRQQLEAERVQNVQTSAQLKEQLTAISKAIVYHGNQTLRTENQSQLIDLLAPFRAKLVDFEQQLQQQELHRVAHFSSLETLVKSLSAQHHRLNESAQTLAQALRSDQKTQGNWGEFTLERLLEISGFQLNIDYQLQPTLYIDGSIQRQDVILQLPENKHIIIDSKVSLTAFERFLNESTEHEKNIALKAHIHSISTHIKQLSSKNYDTHQSLDSPQFVLLFLPLEAAYSVAIQSDPSLYKKAWDQRVVVVTPATLLATLSIIASIWKQAKQSANALQIAQEAGKLYDKFVGFLQDMRLIEKKHDEAKHAFDTAMNKLSTGHGNLIGKMENLKKMGAKATKEIRPGFTGS